MRDSGGASARTCSCPYVCALCVCTCTCYVCADPLSRPVKYTNVMHDTLLDFRDEVSHPYLKMHVICADSHYKLREIAECTHASQTQNMYTHARAHTWALLRLILVQSCALWKQSVGMHCATQQSITSGIRRVLYFARCVPETKIRELSRVKFLRGINYCYLSTLLLAGKFYSGSLHCGQISYVISYVAPVNAIAISSNAN